MESLSLSQGHFQVNNIRHMDSVRFGEEEALIDVLIKDLIVMGASVELGKGRVHI